MYICVLYVYICVLYVCVYVNITQEVEAANLRLHQVCACVYMCIVCVHAFKYNARIEAANLRLHLVCVCVRMCIVCVRLYKYNASNALYVTYRVMNICHI